MRIIVSMLVLLGLVLSAACQANPDDAGVPLEIASSPDSAPFATSEPVSPSQEDTTQLASSLSTPADARLQNLIEKAKEDLAQRLSTSSSQIYLIEAKAVTWSDSSLGCPQPGMAYSEVLTSGYLVHVQSDNKIYEYHTDAEQLVVFCGENTIEYPVKPGDIKDDKPWMPP